MAQADMNLEMGVNSLIPSPSPVVCSHLSDVYHLLANKSVNDDDIYSVIPQKCLGQNGSCPLSIFNYALLVNSTLRPTLACKQPGPKNPKQYSQKASQDAVCKSPVDRSCKMFTNDGMLFCYCNQRKLDWYLRQGLAKLIDEETPAIMLLFEPKRRPKHMPTLENVCVGCGGGNHCLRYQIIPSCYTIHFPGYWKIIHSHDTVPLCVDCQQVARVAVEKYTRKISVEFGIPLYLRVVHPGQETGIQFDERGVYPIELQKAAMALLREGPRLPVNRREKLNEIVRRYYGRREISVEDLKRVFLQVVTSSRVIRRFKKKWFSFRHSTGSTATVPEEDNHAGCPSRLGNVDTSKVDAHDGSYANEETNEVDRELLMRKDDFGNSTVASDITVNGAVSAALNGNTITAETTVYNESSDSTVNVDNSCLSRRQANGLSDLSYPPSDEKSAHAYRYSKHPLMGHEPHGKQVVEYFLKEYGEDGIQEFCQRWRQVFVDAVNPRFLPAGWDIKYRL
ncbi:Exonuclease 3'-5' domain-containing protein 2 [Spatholobus suberectus]|nr:Exonuclease 3'-5' domain-containing protein 2 [Spatholobus suberectus]